MTEQPRPADTAAGAADPSAAAVALAHGPGLPAAPVAGSWADLGVTLAQAIGVELPGATADGMRPAPAVAEK